MDAVYKEEPASLPAGTVTFLLTDIEGSTKRWEKHPRLMQDVVRRHDDILISVVESSGGVDLRKKGEGDSHFAVFNSAAQALRAATQIHRALTCEDWGEVEPIKVRIAIHTGEAEIRNEDYYGQAVNRCARLRGVAHGGQTILSEASKKLAGQLAPDSSLKDLGQHRLKDLLDPERIYQLNVDGLETEFPPLTSLSSAKHNLPVQLSTFIGRVEQLEKIKRLVNKSRLITLVGAGGSGKTRLSLQIGAEVLEEFPDGVWFVPLVGIQDPAMVAQTIAESLPISIQGKDPFEAIVEQYRDARPLLIIDNCEHVVKGVADVINRLLRKCPQMVVLATSRESLAVSGENTFNVPPMECDLEGKAADIESVAALEAVQLFRDRGAKRLSDADILTSDTAADIAALCKKLDGLPLALEQAAANLSSMTPREILNRLERHFSMLELDEAGVEDRHRTIQATIDWSYGMLSEQEKQLFADLSIFSGGWSREAAEFVCCSGPVPADEVSQILERLVKRSLVLTDRPEGLNISRFRMLEPIREFASRRSSDEEGRLSRLFAWSGGLARQAFESGLDAGDGRYRKLVKLDHDNIRRALSWSIQSGACGDKALQLCIWMYRFWLVSGHVREGSGWFQKAMEASQPIAEELRAPALLYIGILAWQEGKLESASKALKASEEAYGLLTDRAGLAKVKANLGNLAFLQDKFEEAEANQVSAAEVFEQIGDLELYATTLENLGVTRSLLGKLDEAKSTLEKAVAIRRQLGAVGPIAKALDSFLGVCAFLGNVLAYRELLIEALGYAVQSEDGFTLENMLELAVLASLEMECFPLAAQAIGAMEVSVETNQRMVPPSVSKFRSELIVRVKVAIGNLQFKAPCAEGRSMGALTVLHLVLERLQNWTPRETNQ